MKIKMEVDPDIREPEIILRCARADPGLLERLQRLSALESGRLTGRLEGQTYLLDPEDVLYADTADRRTFLYTASAVYETELRLYELEERLLGREFFRASKSALVNFNAIKSLRPDLGGRIRLTMENGEAVYVSRQYAPWLKQKLGL